MFHLSAILSRKAIKHGRNSMHDEFEQMLCQYEIRSTYKSRRSNETVTRIKAYSLWYQKLLSDLCHFWNKSDVCAQILSKITTKPVAHLKWVQKLDSTEDSEFLRFFFLNPTTAWKSFLMHSHKKKIHFKQTASPRFQNPNHLSISSPSFSISLRIPPSLEAHPVAFEKHPRFSSEAATPKDLFMEITGLQTQQVCY